MKSFTRWITALVVAGLFPLASSFAATVNGTFKDNADNESGFRIERATGATGGVFAQVGTNLPASPGVGATVAFSDATVAKNTTYRYRIFAFNAGGDSLPSSVASAVVPDTPPAAPSEIVIGTITVAIDDRGNVKAVAVLETPLGTKKATVSSRIEKKSANARGVRALWEWAIPPSVEAVQL